MDVKSIINSYSINSISNFNNFISKKNIMPEGFSGIKNIDSYIPSSKLKNMPVGMYDYSSELPKAKISKETIDYAAQSSGPVEEDKGGDLSSTTKGKAKTETEVKIINGQAYMIITTTDEDGKVSVKKMKLGARISNNISSKKDTGETNGDSSLAEAITM